MSNKHPTEELKLKAIAAFQSGTSAIKIADIFGYDRVTIHRWVRESNAGKNMARKSGSGRPSKTAKKMQRKFSISFASRPLNMDSRPIFGTQVVFAKFAGKN